MKNENVILMINNIVSDLGYTGISDRDSKNKTVFSMTPAKFIEKSITKLG